MVDETGQDLSAYEPIAKLSAMKNLKLYSYFRSSCSYRVRIALKIKNLDYEYCPVHLVKDGGEQNKPEFKNLNATGQVPTLVHGDTVLSQSMAIFSYLEDIAPAPALFPRNSRELAQSIELCEIINSGIQPLQNLGAMRKLKAQFNASKEEQFAWNKFWIHKGFEGLEKKLEKTAGTYSMGGGFSAVDCFLIPQGFNAIRFGIDLNEFPTIQRVYENGLQLEAVKAAAPENQPDAN